MNRYSKHLGIVISILIYGSVYVYLNAIQPAIAAQSVRSGGLQNVDVVLNYLRPVLYSDGKSALIEYNGVCAMSYKTYAVDFPPIKLQPPPKGVTGLAAVREIFRKNKRVTVTEGENGVIIIRIGKVWAEILQTNISRLVLGQDDQYTPNLAISAMLYTKEIRFAMWKFHAHHTLLIETLVSLVRKGQPHLPPLMKDVTADQVLNSIAKTFKGIVVYSSCKQSDGTHLLDIGFAG